MYKIEKGKNLANFYALLEAYSKASWSKINDDSK